VLSLLKWPYRPGSDSWKTYLKRDLNAKQGHATLLIAQSARGGACIARSNNGLLKSGSRRRTGVVRNFRSVYVGVDR
jgi:hypothetical protein